MRLYFLYFCLILRDGLVVCQFSSRLGLMFRVEITERADSFDVG